MIDPIYSVNCGDSFILAVLTYHPALCVNNQRNLAPVVVSVCLVDIVNTAHVQLWPIFRRIVSEKHRPKDNKHSFIAVFQSM